MKALIAFLFYGFPPASHSFSGPLRPFGLPSLEGHDQSGTANSSGFGEFRASWIRLSQPNLYTRKTR